MERGAAADHPLYLERQRRGHTSYSMERGAAVDHPLYLERQRRGHTSYSIREVQQPTIPSTFKGRDMATQTTQ